MSSELELAHFNTYESQSLVEREENNWMAKYVTLPKH